MTLSVEDALSAPAALSTPPNVELAVAMSPPEVSRVKTEVDPEFVMTKGSPVCPVWSFKVRRRAVVEVAPIVATERTSAEVVPTPRVSVTVVSRTRVPSSVKPEVLPASASAPQMRLPEVSVSSVLHETRVAIRKPPVSAARPPRTVDVAVPATRRVEEAWSSPPTLKAPVAVEDACETKPAARVARPEAVNVELKVVAPVTARVDPKVVAPATRRVEEAWSGAFATTRPEAAVEEACETKPLPKVARPSAVTVE